MELEQDPSQPLVEPTVDISTVELGWVPEEGLSYTFRLVTLKSEAFDPVIPANNFSETIETASFALSFLF